MATTLLCGFEMQGGEASTYTVTTELSVVRSGAASARASNPGQEATFQSRAAGGTFRSFANSFRFYLRVETLPPGADIIAQTGSNDTAGTLLSVQPTGVLSVAQGDGANSVSSTQAIPVDSQFHRIDVDVSGTTRNLYVDGVLWVNNTIGAAASARTTFSIGHVGISASLMYFDDLLVDDGSIGAPAAGANNRVLLLVPTAGNNANSWTGGAGGTGDIHGAVDNIPPIGKAAASETNSTQIKNAASGGNLDYTATMQTYTAAGVPAGSIINAVMAICNDAEEVTTGTKAGGIWIASNPAQTAGGNSFDYGDDTSTAAGTFPTGWQTHYGPVTTAPSVTLGTAPTVTVRKTTSTTRVTDVDFMGLYVDFSPPPIGKIIQVNQSVPRASFW